MKNKLANGKSFAFAAIVTEAVTRLTKRGTEYGIINLEDQDTSWKWSLFSEEYAKYKHFFQPSRRLFIRARVEVKQWWDKEQKVHNIRYEVKPMEIHFLEDAYEKLCKEVRLVVGIKDVSRDLAEQLLAQIQEHKGKVPFHVRIVEEGGVFYSDFFNFSTKVNPEDFCKHLKLPIPYTIELL